MGVAARGIGEVRIMSALRQKRGPPLWILVLLVLICISVVGLYVYPPSDSSSSSTACPSGACTPFKDWLPPIPARARTDGEIASRVVIRDVLSVPAVASRNPNRLNERFTELCSILDPARPPKADKVAILRDATRLLKQLPNEAQKLKESNKTLQRLQQKPQDESLSYVIPFYDRCFYMLKDLKDFFLCDDFEVKKCIWMACSRGIQSGWNSIFFYFWWICWLQSRENNVLDIGEATNLSGRTCQS